MKLLLMALLTLSWSFSVAQTISELHDKAEKKCAQKKYKEALSIINIAIEKDPRNIDSRLIIADILKELGEIDKAHTQLSAALIIDKEHAEVHNRLGLMYLENDMLEESLKMYSLAIKHEENDSIKFSYFLNRASAKSILNQTEGAIKDFEAAYEINSKSIALLNNLAATYSKVGESQKSIKMLKEAIVLDPDFLGPYVNLGLAYSRMDSFTQSDHYFSLALKINPKEPLIFSNRAFLYYKQNKLKKALNDINKSIDLYPVNSYAYKNRALIYIAQKKKEEACIDLEKAIKLGFKNRYGDEVEKLYKEHCN